jgi:hypothetical protein
MERNEGKSEIEYFRPMFTVRITGAGHCSSTTLDDYTAAWVMEVANIAHTQPAVAYASNSLANAAAKSGSAKHHRV